MDWGLCARLPRSLGELLDVTSYYEKRMFLRENLMYPSLTVYYLAIVVDLVLRFLWVLSLLPPATLGGLLGHQLSFFLGSVEIIRRSMWGILRVENEHLRLLSQHAPGYLSNEVMQKARLASRAKIDQTDDGEREMEEMSTKLMSGMPKSDSVSRSASSRSKTRVMDGNSNSMSAKSINITPDEPTIIINPLFAAESIEDSSPV